MKDTLLDLKGTIEDLTQNIVLLDDDELTQTEKEKMSKVLMFIRCAERELTDLIMSI